ncbi:branched-chain amino acid ABC transporter permease [Orrella marina]|uniref:Branched-chain amino acid ABC transporter permease n=1 Tax=Orrella marina TaxID=2163011 RepID=A0A2R4XM36_9BURK|nr:branched-chain amino acid ABC transporter permease [Orrella marina]AWB34858.1 branched-chain amino acid ABC transporter permease [Orrella marina]AWB35245.1 branched-chain amino acid ABC transporter permease [Orrella marina]
MLAYLQNIFILFSINAILALTLNFIMGYAGIFSLAHAIFFGVGAYTAAYVALNFTDSLLLCMLAAMGLSAILSMALALPALRVRGEYFVAASLGLQIIGVTIFSEWKSVTGGLGGMVGIPPPVLFGYTFTSTSQFVGLSLAILLGVLGVLALLVRGSFGRSLMAIRDSESAAQAYGKHVNAIKTLSVAVSAALAALGGGLYAFYMSFVNVEVFTLNMSILLMAMVIIGGTGTLMGPLVGAAIVMALPAALTYLPFIPPGELGTIQQIIYGAAMVILMMYRPGGLVGGRSKEKSA